MKDIQNQRDTRDIRVDHVGVSNIRYPIRVKDRLFGVQDTVAEIDMMVELLPQFKGTHMSRFLEILNTVQGEITMANIPDILKDMREKLETPRSKFNIRFPYFIKKSSPVSEATSLFSVDTIFSGYSDQEHGESFILGINIPVTTLCPCSKEISNYGAHNQRSFVSVYCNFNDFVWIEDVVEMVESAASCEIYPLLKRSDERFVTEKAYENPQFAEDIVRNVTAIMQEDENINWFRIETLHLESIHTHNAYARIERVLNPSKLLKNHVEVLKGF